MSSLTRWTNGRNQDHGRRVTRFAGDARVWFFRRLTGTFAAATENYDEAEREEFPIIEKAELRDRFAGEGQIRARTRQRTGAPLAQHTPNLPQHQFTDA